MFKLESAIPSEFCSLISGSKMSNISSNSLNYINLQNKFINYWMILYKNTSGGNASSKCEYNARGWSDKSWIIFSI